MGQLVFQATAGGQTALVGPNPSTNFSLNVPAVNSTLATLAAQTFTGQQTDTVDASISGLTVGKGGGSQTGQTALGANAFANNSTGTYGTAIGYFAAVNNTSGQITALGSQCLYNNTTGTANTALGISASYSNTTGGNNTSVGTQALYANTTASNNTAVGYQSANANTTGQITAVGSQSLLANTTGANNVAVGILALQANTTASNNTAVGYQALYTNTTSANITAVGSGSLNQTTGTENTAIGHNSGNSTTSGTSNVYVGHQSGNWAVNHTTGTDSVFIGNKTSPAAGSDSSTIVIGSGTTGKGSSTGFINAGGGVYQGNNSTLWSITSDARLKKNIVDNTDGLDKITAIKVRNFEYRTADEVTDLPKEQAINIKGVQLGAIAQELQAILPDCVKTESTGVMSVDASNLTWYLINAVKELNAKITALENK